MGIRLRGYARTKLKHEQIQVLEPICSIVIMYACNEGDIEKEDVIHALADYREKHKNDSLAARVSELFEPTSLDTPSRHIAYWKKVNPNTVKIAACCLEKEVTEYDSDALEAATIVANNFLSQYEESLPIIKDKMIKGNESAKQAYQKTKNLFLVLKNAYLRNEDYIKENHSYFSEEISGFIDNIDAELQ